MWQSSILKGHIFLSLEQLARNSCKIPEDVLCPAVIMSPASLLATQYKATLPH